MPAANIEINGVASSNDNLLINSIVQLSNNGTGGELTYFWEILDQPDGTPDALSSSTIQNPTFTPRKEGSYLLRLTVNENTPFERVNTRVAAIRQLKSNERIPAATETTEVDPLHGWKTALNRQLARLDAVLGDANLITAVCSASGTPSVGDMVAFTGMATIKTGLPGQADAVVVQQALATSATLTSGPLGIVVGTPSGAPAAANALVLVRVFGLVEVGGSGSPAVGDPVFVSDTGQPSLSSGTNSRQVGRVVEIGGGSYRWFVEGSPTGTGGFGLTNMPISVKDFAAKGDYDPIAQTGTDDRTAFLNAFATAIATKNNLRIPPGNYFISKYVLVTGAVKFKVQASAFVSIYYQSDDLSIVTDAIATSYEQARSAFFFRNCQDISVEDVEFVGRDTPEVSNQNVGKGIYSSRVVGARITNCRARGGATLYAQDNIPDSTGSLGNTIAVSSGLVTLTNNGDPNSSFHPAMLGRQVTIVNSANPVNDGLYTVVQYVSSTQLRYINASAIAESGNFTWTVNDGDNDTKLNTCRLDGCRAVTFTGSGGSFKDCTFIRPMTKDLCGIPDQFVVQGTTVTLIDGSAPWTASLVGSLIKIVGAPSSGNDVIATITSVVPASAGTPAKLTYTNASGVTEIANRANTAWWIAGGERVGLGAGVSAISSSSGVVTFTADRSVFKTDDIGKTLRITDATSSGNNGHKVITRVLSATQVQYVQTGAVSEAYGNVFSIDGYDNSKGDNSVGPTITSTTTSVGANTLTDTTLTMVPHAYAGRILIDSTNRQWSVTDNTTTAFTLAAAGASPAAGAYTCTSGATYGSTHAIYYFAGRSNILIDGCTFRGIRTIGVKVSGSAAPIHDVEIQGCTFDTCGAAIVAGADDSQTHANFHFHDNKLIDCGTNRDGWSEQQGITVLGARNVKICDNQLTVTQDAVASLVNGQAVGGFYGIFAGRFLAGISQPLEDVTVDGNTLVADPNSTAASRVVSAAIHLERVGQRAYWRTGGTLTKQLTGPVSMSIVASAGTITRASGSWLADGYYVGGQVATSGFTNGGNNVTKTIASVTATVITVTSNAGLVDETHSASATNGVMTLLDNVAALSQTLTGSSLQIINAPDSGNNNARALETKIQDFTVLSVTGTSTLTYLNMAGVGGGVSAGTYRIKPKTGNTAARGGASQARGNVISGYGAIGIETLGCVGVKVVGNIFNGLSINASDKSSTGWNFHQNTELQATSNGARIQISTSTAWPIIYDNWITNGALAGGNLQSEPIATHSEMGIGINGGGAVDHPLLGVRGRVPACDGRPNIVFGFGGEFVDGDQAAFNGVIWTYKRLSPNPSNHEFNGMIFGAGSNVNEYGEPITVGLVDGDGGVHNNGLTGSGFTGEEYSAGLTGAPITGHVRLRTTNPSTTFGLGFIDTINVLNPTAMIVLRNDVGGGEAIATTRGEETSTGAANQTAVWSPGITLTGGLRLWADNDAARTLLASGSPATGLITCTTKANYRAANADNMTISDGINPTVTYYFDTAGAGGGTGVQVNISTDTTAPQVAARLRTTILASQPGLGVTDNADGTLTVVHQWPGPGGNVAMVSNVANAGHTVRGLANGGFGGYRPVKLVGNAGAVEVLLHAKSTNDAGASLGAQFRWSQS